MCAVCRNVICPETGKSHNISRCRDHFKQKLEKRFRVPTTKKGYIMGLKQRYDVFDAELLHGAVFAGDFEIPVIGGNHYRPRRTIPFDQLKQDNKEKDLWVHFYVHDYRFLPVLRTPGKYLPALRKYAGVIGLDNSVYRDLPLAEQIHGIYLNRLFDYHLQRNGIPVIPNISWGDHRSFDFCFDGIKPHTTVAVSSYGCVKRKVDREYFLDGFARMLKCLRPDAVVFHGTMLEDVKYLTEKYDVLLLPVKSRLDTVFSKEVS